MHLSRDARWHTQNKDSKSTKTRFYKTVNDNNKVGEIVRAHLFTHDKVRLAPLTCHTVQTLKSAVKVNTKARKKS